MRHTLITATLLYAVALVPAFGAEISLDTLLEEMTDCAAVALYPSPAYTCRQSSSYDRAARSPSENWFANGDASNFIRQETNGGRSEWVLLDADGPGAIVRFWITSHHYKTNFRFYLDGAAEPAIVGNAQAIISGGQLAPPPLSQETARGHNLYLPIPYARHIKVTCDNMPEQKNLYYQINYRTYAPGTKVQSYTDKDRKALAQKIESVCKKLDRAKNGQVAAEKPEHSCSVARSATVKNESLSLVLEKNGKNNIAGDGNAMTRLSVKVEGADPVSLTRHLILSIRFDGQETVWCPVGEFFGSGVGVNPHKTWYTDVAKDGTMLCHWVMPFKSKCEITVTPVGPAIAQKKTITVNATASPRKWTDRTMYFHCDWRQDRGIETLAGKGTRDWNYITLAGKGVYVGDVLSVRNLGTSWWGEGDEKIYVDGEKFPSHFGTGTEDYYGYAWCTPKLFDSPFRAQPRCEGPQNNGHTTNLRYRALDAIPFTNDFRFDMEIWHWAATKIDYAVATFWYGLPGAKAVSAPDLKRRNEEASAKVEPKTPVQVAINGFELAGKFRDGNPHIQKMDSFKKNGYQWFDNQQLFWTDTKPGDRLSLVAVAPKNAESVRFGFTSAVDYGTIRIWLDGKKLGEPVDLYNARKVIRITKSFPLPASVKEGPHEFVFEITGKNAAATNYYIGCDLIWFD